MQGAQARNHNRPEFYSERQRVVVITFDTPEDAQAWDDAGQPLDGLPLKAVA